MNRCDKFVHDALLSSSPYQKRRKDKERLEKTNRSLLLSSVRSPIITSFQASPSARFTARKTISAIERESKLIESTESERMRYMHKQIVTQTDFERIYKDGDRYFLQLGDAEREIYRKILACDANDEQFLINVTNPSVNGHKVASAFNLDNILNHKMLAYFKDGYLRPHALKYYHFISAYLVDTYKEINQKVDAAIRQLIEHIDYFNCAEQVMQLIVRNVAYSDDVDECTVLNAVFNRRANSLGISRLYALMLRYFNLECHVVCADNCKGDVLYWNIIEYSAEYIAGNMASLQCSMFWMYQKRSICAFVDVSSAIVNRIVQHIPYYTVNVDRYRICLEYRLYTEFAYPETLTLHRVWDLITSSAVVHALIKGIASELGQLENDVSTYYYDVFIKPGYNYSESLRWIEDNWQILISVTLRYAPGFKLVECVLPRVKSAALTLVFQRATRRDIFLYDEVISEFSVSKLESIADFVLQRAANIKQLILALDTSLNMSDVCGSFPETELQQILANIVFSQVEHLDSCIFRYSEHAMLVVVLFIQVPLLGGVSNVTRHNRFALPPDLRYIYSHLVQGLLMRRDEVVIPYAAELDYRSLLKVVWCVALDYPEFFYVPTTGIRTKYDAHLRELRVIYPMQDAAVLQQYLHYLNSVCDYLPPPVADAFENEKLVLYFCITNLYQRITEVEDAYSAYDCLVSYRVTSQSLALGFALLCHKMGIPACAIRSDATRNCCTLVWLQNGCTIVDLMLYYRSRLKITGSWFYPTFSINISWQYYKLVDSTFRERFVRDATLTANYIFTNFSVSSMAADSIDKIKKVFEEYLQYYYRTLVVQISHVGLAQKAFFDYLRVHMPFVAAHLLQKHYKVHPCLFQFTCCKQLPVILVRLRYEPNFGICSGNFDDLGPETQREVGAQLRDFWCDYKQFVVLRLSRRTLSAFYKEYYYKYAFETSIRGIISPIFGERLECFHVLPCFAEYCILFIFLKCARY